MSEREKFVQLKDRRIAELEEQLRIAKDWAYHNTQQAIDLVCENAALKAKFAELEKQEIPHHWDCGCGWHNGLNFEKCAMCGRTPSEGSAKYRYTAPIIPDLERKLLEARIDELRIFADSRNYKISPEQDIEERITKLRTQLAALNKGE